MSPTFNILGEKTYSAARRWRTISVVLLVIAGCKSQPIIEPSGPPPPYHTIAQTHNERLAKLQRVEGNGVVEIRWRDEKGRHFEQGNVELWLQFDLPSGDGRLATAAGQNDPSQGPTAFLARTALRVEKLGELLLWLGSNEERYWLFDLTRDEKTLYTALHTEPVNYQQEGALSIRPLVLLDLLAFTPLPVDQAQEPDVQFDQTHGAWAVKTTGRSGPIRTYFDPVTLLPSRVEALDAGGRPTIYSTLRRYQGVRQEGVSLLAFPKMAHLVDIATVESDDSDRDPGQTGEVKLVLNEASTMVSDEILGRVFDFDRLLRGLNPQRIEGELPPRQALAPTAP